MIAFDAAVAFDSPDYTFDGEDVGAPVVVAPAVGGVRPRQPLVFECRVRFRLVTVGWVEIITRRSATYRVTGTSQFTVRYSQFQPLHLTMRAQTGPSTDTRAHVDLPQAEVVGMGYGRSDTAWAERVNALVEERDLLGARARKARLQRDAALLLRS